MHVFYEELGYPKHWEWTILDKTNFQSHVLVK